MSNLIAEAWSDYELIDTGNGHRLERFGAHTVVRPEPSALWKPSAPEDGRWDRPDFRFNAEKETRWEGPHDLIKEGWLIEVAGARLRVRPTPFRHMGIFPEQAPQWDLAAARVRERGGTPRVLNLFAYTGAASVLLAKAGAMVCHVDASKGSVMWAKENAHHSGLPDDAIRWIVDDVPKFLQREIRRGNKYDLILMDPPVFGRGPQGEIWRLEEQISGLASMAGQLLSDEPLGLFVNTYATTLYPENIKRTIAAAVPLELRTETVGIREKVSESIFQTGFCILS